ncbi:hypothetical protein D3C85_90220 [compost metagenome]
MSISVGIHQLELGDRIVHLNQYVVGIKHIKGGRYKTIKQNIMFTLSDGRVILAKQGLILNVHASGKMTVPWKRETIPNRFEVERVDSKES